MNSGGAEINSEAKKNEVQTTLNFFTNYCVVIMEQGPMDLDAEAPRWRISASLAIHDAPMQRRLITDLPFVTIPPLVHKCQIVAIAKAPLRVKRWTFRFESDAGRSKANVWLIAGNSTPGDCGIFTIPYPQPWTSNVRAI